MRAVKGKNTSLEKKVASALHRQGLRFRRNIASLPGKPDFVFTKAKVVVFVDGDFWHGWRYPDGRTSSLITGKKRSSEIGIATDPTLGVFAEPGGA